MKASAWKPVTIDIDRATEFVGDDVDRYSKILDLLEGYEFITVMVPALSASGVITPYIQRDEKVAESAPLPTQVGTIPTPMVALDDDATGHFAHATSSGAGSIAVIFRIGGAQYIRIHVAADQAADRTFYVKGFNREPMST